MELLVLAGILILLFVGGALGWVIGKDKEGDRWSKSANRKFVEFEQKLYEVTEVDLRKPIDYER